MKKSFFTMVVMAVFAIGFAASDEEGSSSSSTTEETPKMGTCKMCGKYKELVTADHCQECFDKWQREYRYKEYQRRQRTVPVQSSREYFNGY